MCALLCDGMPLERRGHPAAMFSPGALYTLLDCGGQSPWGWAVQLVGAASCTKPAPLWTAWVWGLPTVLGGCGPRGTVECEGKTHGAGPPPTLVPPFNYCILPGSLGAMPHVAKCDFPTHAMYEACVDSGTVVEGTEGTFGGGVVPRRACTIPSYRAPQPFNPEHASVPTHRQPGFPVCTVESGDTPPLEDPFSRRSGSWPAAHRNIFGTLGIVIQQR